MIEIGHFIQRLLKKINISRYNTVHRTDVAPFTQCSDKPKVAIQ